MSKNNSPHKVKLGDDYQYLIKGSGEASYKLDFQKYLKMKDFLYLLGLKKNILSIHELDAKGMRVKFVDGQVLMCPKGNTIHDAIVIGEEHEGLYKLKEQPEQALVHESIELSELWHWILAHAHWRELPIASKAISGLLEIHENHEGICKGCAQGKNAKKTFPINESKSKGILNIVHPDVCGPMSFSSIRGYVYYVSFIDDFSHKTWI